MYKKFKEILNEQKISELEQAWNFLTSLVVHIT